jgi:hypothetical protein
MSGSFAMHEHTEHFGWWLICLLFSFFLRLPSGLSFLCEANFGLSFMFLFRSPNGRTPKKSKKQKTKPHKRKKEKKRKKRKRKRRKRKKKEKGKKKWKGRTVQLYYMKARKNKNNK